MIGVPPYSPGDYLDVEEDDDGGVTIRLADYFRRPLQLTPAEGLALLAAGRALLAVPGSDPAGPLATALGKLERALDLPDLVVEVGAPKYLDEIRDAVAPSRTHRDRLLVGRPRRTDDAGRSTPPSCSSRSAPGTRARTATGPRPTACSASTGSVGSGRRESTSTRRPGDLTSSEVYNPAPDDPRVTLRLAPAAAWVAEAYPTESVTERPDGSLDVVLAVSEPVWLERLLLRLGPDAEVVDPPEWRAAGADTAARVLARYTGVQNR